MRSWGAPGLRTKVAASFALGATVLSVLVALATYGLVRGYLVQQREDSATRQAFADASYVREGLLTAGAPVSDVLAATSPPAGADVLVHRQGQWYSTSLDAGGDAVPTSLRAAVVGGAAGVAWERGRDGPVLAVGVPLPAVGAEFYELAVTTELERTLGALRLALAGFAALTAGGGALLGAWAARRAVAPLHSVAGAAARIASGDLGARVPTTSDPDLATIVGAFNSMVDALQERIEREGRFTADVSHELRSPLTTLVTGVGLLERRREELPPRSRQALDLVVRELARFARTLDDLLELARLEAGAAARERADVAVDELVEQALEAGGRSAGVLVPGGGGLRACVDKQQLSRALVNLFDNADRHGGGLVAVSVVPDGAGVLVHVDDAGSGVPVADRERIFERFARAGSRRSLPGAGLGLSLVTETVRAHGGDVWCAPGPSGAGARFTVRLPRTGTATGAGGAA